MQPHQTTNNPRKKFIISVITTIMPALFFSPVMEARAAETWSEIEIRGIKPGMTFSEVEAYLKKNWPKARIKVRYQKLKHANSRYQFGSSIEMKDLGEKGRESLRIQFLPPTGIDQDPASSTVKRMNRSQDRREEPLVRGAFVKQLIGKYGPPSFQNETNLKWIYDRKGKILSKLEIESRIATNQKTCDNMQRERKRLTKLLMQSTSSETSRGISQKLQQMMNIERDCNKALYSLNNCRGNINRIHCPYMLEYSWTARSETKGFVTGFGASFYGIPLDKVASDNIARLKKALMKKALEDTKTRADSKNKADL